MEELRKNHEDFLLFEALRRQISFHVRQEAAKNAVNTVSEYHSSLHTWRFHWRIGNCECHCRTSKYFVWFCSKAHWGHPLQGYDAHVERYRTAAVFVSPCAKCELIPKDFAPLQLATLQCSHLLIPAWLTCKSLQFFVPCLLIGARSCGCGYFKIPYHAVEEQPGDVQPGRTGRLRWVEVKQTALHG